ncbi:uncharacterized protein SPAPADRAFT_142796 [Spathaspora passalidarum NRRL Y-27907]|uniref:Uncharacterized protein n=1 Tax=Spathaspora passalidarum (strain NRRL Y-27907 / 11-Y1) TaxID=619300 RepID=G3ASH8_SPAPN|nr:uncharacterized protein SPAPADRAFT_142796 [Spathaspora passalidarum NRRL Y-27907]EGW31096.1 hypothetical protein SPAPADRAFT_142796 [Spathaspora passalidarum NRRL Y-27907]
MSSVLSTGLKGLVAGLVIPPVVTKFVIIPYLFRNNFKEIHYIQHELDHVGWLVRGLEENKGYHEDDLYRPASYYGPYQQ